jgi:hypothetical protein
MPTGTHARRRKLRRARSADCCTGLLQRSSSLTEDAADAHKLAEEAAADWAYASDGKPLLTRSRNPAAAAAAIATR